jgi:hypothetical protein
MSENMQVEVVQKQQVAVQSAAMSLKQVTDRVNLVHKVLETVMKNGTHYGTVPGCGNKKVLLKPGADVLAMTFRLVPQFKVERNDLENGHREYDVTCSMFGPDGTLLGQGVGSASTMEKKYRYRGGQENPDIADVYNTVLKIAKKRAHIDATLTCTAAADLFTQDLIDDDGEQQQQERTPVVMAPVNLGSAAPVQERQQPAPAPTPAQTDAPKKKELPDDMQEAGGKVAVVNVKEDPAGKWKKWGIKIGDDWYSTFDAELGPTLGATKGHEVTVQYVQDAKGYKTLHSIEKVD